jgi:hypothetical protein
MTNPTVRGLDDTFMTTNMGQNSNNMNMKVLFEKVYSKIMETFPIIFESCVHELLSDKSSQN